MLREAGGGSEWPDFASIQGGRRGCAGRCSRSWLDSLNGDDAFDYAELQDASAWRPVHCNGGASSTMAAVVVSFVSGSNGGGVAALGREKQGRLGFAGRHLSGDLVEGKSGGGVVEKVQRSSCSPRDHVRKTTDR
jgi:hypothetical protein